MQIFLGGNLKAKKKQPGMHQHIKDLFYWDSLNSEECWLC